MTDDQDSRARMLADAVRLDEAHVRITGLQRDLAAHLRQLAMTTGEAPPPELWRACLQFDREVEAMKSGLEQTHDRLVADARTASSCVRIVG